MKPYFTDGQISIYHGDCREILPHVAADVMVTDPPYGVNIGKHVAVSDHRARHLAKQAYASYDDTPENFRAIVVPAIEAGLAMVRRAIVFCAAHMAWDLPRPSAIGGVFLPSACGRNRWGFASLAHCLLYGQAPALEKGSKPTAISSTDAAEKNGHPMPKPLTWMTWAVSLASLPDEVVLDPFMGSGTTLRACKDLNRKAIGIEIEEKYCEIAARRMSQQTLFATTA
jgi:site-specific DNA-methyltransferase (adenine-specific)